MSRWNVIAALQRIKRFRKICRKERFDVAISFMGMSEVAVWACLGMKTKVIISLRNDPNWLYPKVMGRIYTKLIFSFADGGVFQTRQALEWTKGKIQRRSTIILNPISSGFFEVQYRPHPNLIVATGRLTCQKNYDMMLNAMAKVAKAFPNVMLSIYGEGKEKDRLKKIAESLDIGDKVFFCGVCNDIPKVLASADLFLLSSDVEGLPNGLMEAMAVGVPSVSTNCPCGGPELLLGDNERGILVPVGDSDKMADAIKSLLSDDMYRSQISVKAREYAKGFCEDVIVHKWENYVREIVGGKQ